jgi:Calcineurin-like phosphoesterase/Purple acid Phosphatase, N-terminal domain
MRYLSLLVLGLFVFQACQGNDAQDAKPDETSPPNKEISTSSKDVQVDVPKGEELLFLDVQMAAGPLAPKGIHLTWEDSPATSVTVTWNIDQEEVKDYSPYIWFSEDKAVRGDEHHRDLPYDSQMVLAGDCVSYTEQLMGTPVGERYHVACMARLNGLNPNTAYFFRVGTWEGVDLEQRIMTGAVLSPVKTFTTGLEKGSREPFRFISAGDSRGGYEAMTLYRQDFLDAGGDFWLFNGDMNQSGSQVEWFQWFDAMGAISENHVIMPVHGNHEIFAELFFMLFPVPTMEGLPEESRHHGWSFDYGNMHVVGLDTNTEDRMIPMKPWLEQDLKAASEDDDIDWIIVMTHYPPYSSSTKHGSTLRVQEHFLPIFEKYGVDVVFAGHDHVYERTYQIKDNQVVEAGGIFHVVLGGFFSPGYTNGSDWFTAVSHHGDKSNYGVVDVNGGTFKLTVYSGDSTEVLDELTLTK